MILKRKVRKILIIWGSIFSLILCPGVSASQPLESSDSGPFVPGNDIYEVIDDGVIVSSLNNSKLQLVNNVDGYSLVLPAEMKIVDAGSTNIRIALEDKHRRMEIYKQPLSGLNANTYISYSNRFLENTNDHKNHFHKSVEINGCPAEINEWSRKKLSQVANDKNYYASIDIIEKDCVYTFFIKSDLPFDLYGGYMDLIEGFSTFTPSVSPASPKFKQTVNKLWNAETKEFYEKHFSADSSLSWGIFEYSAPQAFDGLKELEAKLNYDFKFMLVYKHVHKIFPRDYVKKTLQSAYDNGKTVELTLQTTAQDTGEGNMVYDILDGKYDAFLESFAAETADFGHPVLFRLCNEMNGDWCEYSGYHTAKDAELYKELYKYVYKIFEDARADNVIWVWNPNEKSFPDFKWNNEIVYYPGDEYVDIVGLTGYNTGTYYQGEVWRSFTEIYDPLYQRMERISEKPLMITEFSSSSVGGNKGEWVNEMFSNMYKYPRIKAAIWWDGCDWDTDGNIARPYFIDESEELIKTFREHLQYYK